MADGLDQSPGYRFRQWFPAAELFRCFQVALDPRKLLVAAAGILAMSLGWWLLSVLFHYQRPNPESQEYTNLKPVLDSFAGKKNPDTGKDLGEDDARAELKRQYDTDLRKWSTLNDLAGPGGRLRTMPWYEYRGPNPFLFVTTLLDSPASLWFEQTRTYVASVAPVLVEPLAKLLMMVANLVAPTTGAWTRLFLLLALVWFFAVWGFAGGVITRLAAVQLTGKDRITLRQAVLFVANRYTNYLLSPVVPLLIIGAVIVGLFVFGLLGMIPLLGDVVLYGIGLPLILVAGAIMAVFLVGLVGYPLMYPTLSVEGDSSDTFDALSRSINYVFQAPWQYIWYGLVAVLYGAVVTFFVLFFASLTVYVGKWAVGLPAAVFGADSRKPDFLFVYAPESFGWKELLLKGSDAEVEPVAHVGGDRVKYLADGTPAVTGRVYYEYTPVHPNKAAEYRRTFSWYNVAGAGMVAFWLALFFLMVVGFTYSFFWSAATMVYLLMRRKVDEAELDEIYLEEDEPEAPLAPPKAAEPAPASTSLPVLSGVSPPPATLPFSPPPPPPPVAVVPPVVVPPVVPPPAADVKADAPKADDKP